MSNDDDDESNIKLQAPSDFDGPTKERKCTDILCTLLLLVMWAAMTGVGIYAVKNGDYRVVLYPMDYTGNICGIKYKEVDMTDYPKLVYVNSLSGGVCVKNCPKVANLTDIHSFITYNGVYQEEGSILPNNFVEVADYSNSSNVQSCTKDTCDSWNSVGIMKGYGFAFYAVNSFETLGGTRCMADPVALKKLKSQINVNDASILKIDILDKGKAIMSNLYSDLYISRNYLMMAFGVAMAFGLVYSLLLRVKCVLSILVWSSIALTIGMFIGAGFFSFSTGNRWDTEVPKTNSSSSITAVKAAGIVLFVIGGILILLTIFLRKQIQLAMGCVKQAARSIGSMPLIMFLPVIQTLGLLAFGIIWMYYAVHLASVGHLKTTSLPTNAAVTVRSFEYETFVERCGWYLLFCYFWTSAFIAALGSIIIAMSVAKWYFSRDKKKINSCTVIQSIRTTAFYHTGTAAFGSLIIAIIQIIRAIIAKFQKKAKQMDSKVAQALLCCCQCCFCCLEKIMRFINKNAYIQTAIFSTPFCSSAKRAFFLILRNALRVGSIGYVSALVSFIGKIFISVMTTGMVYMVMENHVGDQLHSLFAPVAFVFLISYCVADIFMDLFDMSTSTILQCFIADEEMFSGKQCFADGDMRKFINDF